MQMGIKLLFVPNNYDTYLFEKQFVDKIFKTHRTRIYINNADNDNYF